MRLVNHPSLSLRLRGPPAHDPEARDSTVGELRNELMLPVNVSLHIFPIRICSLVGPLVDVNRLREPPLLLGLQRQTGIRPSCGAAGEP